jgi:GT2 family glycosyltransferase
MAEPAVTVAIPSHDRPERLKRLLDGLREQTLPADRFEVIVCHDDAGPDTERVLREQGGGRVRGDRIPHGEGGPGLQRNRAWRLGRAPLVAFIDDDCRPARGWLENLLTVAEANPGAVVEGATKPDPEELQFLEGPHARTLDVDPPSTWGATCNILYPRELLERLRGFDEGFLAAGEDTDLMLRALAAGSAHVGAPDALVWHAVDPGSLARRLRSLGRWQHLALVARRHPGIRAKLLLGVFWKPSHARLVPALAGLVLAGATRRPWWLLLGLPWLRLRRRWYGASPRALAASVRDTAAVLIVDTGELLVMVRGSVRYRTFLL